MADVTLLIFAKYPAAGQVMTRLCPPLTPDAAAAVQRSCIRLICERAFRDWPTRPVLCASPDDREMGFREIVGPFLPIVKQGEGDLGQRLLRGARRVLNDDGQERVLMIGSDSPTIPAERFREAGARLGSSDAVIGPAHDGGFYLIGLRKTTPGMFDGVEWGTEHAAAQTIERLRGAGMTVAELEPWYDIDRPDDLHRALHDLRTAGRRDAYELQKVVEQALAAAMPAVAAPGSEVKRGARTRRRG